MHALDEPEPSITSHPVKEFGFGVEEKASYSVVGARMLKVLLTATIATIGLTAIHQTAPVDLVPIRRLRIRYYVGSVGQSSSVYGCIPI